MPSSTKDSAGNVFLLGNFFELGISPDGNFGTSAAAPAGYFTGVGETKVGMTYNPAGLTAAHNTTNVDFFLPGTPFELFTVGYIQGASTVYGSNYYLGGTHQVTNVSLTNTSSGNTLSATYVGIYNANLQVTIAYSFGVNDLFYSADVTLKNIGATSMSDARYMRMVNADNTTDYTGNYSTVNTVQNQQPTSGSSLVLASNPTGDAYQVATGYPTIFGYYSTETNTRVSNAFALSPVNPFSAAAYSSVPAVGSSNTANNAISITYDAGVLAAGQSKSFNYSSLLTNNLAATIAAINSNTPPTFTGGLNTGLTLTQDAAITTISNAILKVVDAEQANASLTYTIATAPTKGTLTKSGVSLTANSTFTQADIDNGLIGYTPTSGINGVDSLVFGVSDGVGGLLSAQTFNLTINAPAPVVVITPPVAVDDTGNTTEAGGNNNSENANSAAGNVVTNDTDTDGRALIINAIRTGNIEGGGTAGTIGQPLVGTYGSLTLNADGSYIYIVNDGNSTVQALKLGDTLIESFNYTVSDGSSTDNGVLTLTINGSNDSPLVTNLNGDNNQFWLGSNTPVLLDIGQDATVIDPDTTDYNNATLSVSFATGSLGSGIFSVDGITVQAGNDSTMNVGETVAVSGITIGTVTANSKASNGLTIALNANATSTSVQTLLQNLFYIENSSDTTGTGNRLFNIQINESGTTAMTPVVVILTEKIPVPSLALATDTGKSATDTITNSGVVNVSNLVTNATWQYSTDNGTNWIIGSGTTFTVMGDGTKSVLVRQLDVVGHSSSNSNALVFTLDTTAATSPVLALTNDTGISNADKITQDGLMSLSGLETGASWQYSEDNGVTWNSGSGTNFALTSDGMKSVVVHQTDVAGNSSPASLPLNFTLDGIVNAPLLTLTNDTGTVGTDGITRDGLVNVSGLESGASWQYSENNGVTWNAGGGTSFTLTGDGIKSIIVRQTDVAGNISSNSNTLNFTLDASILVPSLVLANDTGRSNTDKITSNGAVTISNLETSASWQYSEDSGVTWNSGSGSSFTLTGDGSKSVLVRQTDVAGNISSNGSLNFVLDNNAIIPTLTLVTDTGNSNTDSITSNGSVNVSGLETGANWQYSQNSGANWLAGSGTDLTLTSDGIKSIIAYQTDVAGNTSAASTAFNFTLDSTINTPLLTLVNDTGNATDKITNDGLVSVANLENGASWQYSEDAGVTWTAGSNADLTLTGDGLKSVVVRQTDIAGNISPNSSALTFTLDTSILIPALTLTNDTGNTNTDAITSNGAVSVSDLETGASWQYSEDSGVNWMTGSGSNFNLIGDGIKSVIVRQTDVAGNSSPNSTALNFTLDSIIATPSLTLANDTGNASDAITSNGLVNVSGLENGASWQYSEDAGVTWTTGSNASFTLIGDGTKSVIVRQTDVAGNVSANSTTLNFTLDNVIATPLLTLTNDTGIAADAVTNNGLVNVSGLETGASWQYSQDAGVNWTTGSNANFTLTGNGTKSVIVRQTDVAGNVSSISNPLNFTLDTSIATPTLTLTNDTGNATDAITNNGLVSISDLENGASWQYSEDAGVNWTTGSGTSFNLTGDGTKSVIVQQTDIAGNVSSTSAPLNFTLDSTIATPQLTLVNDTGNVTDAITNDGLVNVSGLENGASWQYSQDAGVTWTIGNSTNFTLTGDGAKSVIVRQTDVAGNKSATSTPLNFTLDNTIATPSLTLVNDTGIATDAITRNGLVNVSGLENGASWQYSEDAGVNWITGNGTSFTLTGDGTKSVVVRQTDVAGNISLNSTPLNLTLDSAIATPLLTLLNDTGHSNTDGITRDGSIDISNLESGASWQYSEDSGVTWSTGSNIPLILTGDGYKSIIVNQTDVAGNVSLNSSTLTFTLKSTESTPLLVLNNDTGSQNNDRISRDGTVTISDLTNAVSWQYSIDNGNNWIIGSGSSFVLFGDGNKSVIAQKTDAAGNMSTSDALNFVLDTNAAPLGLSLETDTGKNDDLITSNGTVIVSGIESGASWKYSQDGGVTWITGSGTRFTLAGDGNKSVVVQQTDVAGNNSSSGSFNFTLDGNVITPTLALINDTGRSATDRITSNGFVGISGLENGASWEYSLNNGANWTAGSGTNFEILGEGLKSVILRQIDITGNISANSAALNFTLDKSVAAPVLTLNADTANNFDGITSDGTVNVSGLENGATWEYSTDNGANWQSGNGNSFTLTGDGNKYVIARQLDAAGNLSANSPELNFMLDDTTLPPVLTLKNDTGSSNTDKITNDGTVSVFGLENGALWQYSVDNGSTWRSGSGDSFKLTGNGNKSVIVTQTDAAGNVSANSAPLNFMLTSSTNVPTLTLAENTGITTDTITRNGTVNVSDLVIGANWQYSIDDGLNWITGSGSGFTLTGDGHKSVIVKQTDIAGNISLNSSPLNFTLDTFAVSPTLVLLNDTGISNIDAVTRDGTLSVSGLENGATWQYSQDNGLNWITGHGTNFTLTGDDYKSVVIRQIDVAGNLSPNSNVFNFTLDSIVMSPSLTLAKDTGRSNTDAITSNGMVTVSGIENGANWQYSQDGGVNWTTGNGTNFTLTGDGIKSVIVRQTDVAGNISINSTPLNFTLDSLAISPTLTLINDTGNTNTDGITYDGRVRISGLESGATWQYSTNGGENWITGIGSSFALSDDGVKSVVIRQRDVAGNVITNNTSLDFTLDTTVKTPQLALLNDTGTSSIDGITRDGRVSISNLESGATWQYSFDAGITWTTGSGDVLTLIGEGKKSVIVRQTDIAGNKSLTSSALIVTLQSTETTPILELNNDTGIQNDDRITNDGTVTISDLKNAASWRYSTDNGNSWIVGSDSHWVIGTNGRFSLSGDGDKSIIAQKTDVAGNISTSGVFHFTLDTNAAALSLALKNDSGKNDDAITNDGTVMVSGIENGASWQYSQDNGLNWTEGSGTSFTLIGDGNKSVMVRQTDAAGNNSQNSSPLNFILHSTSPSPVLTLVKDTGSSDTDAITRNGMVTISGLETGASWEYSLDDGLNWTAGNDASFTLTGDGYKSVIARQTDLSGNMSFNSSPLNFTLDKNIIAPVLTLNSDTGSSETDKITRDGSVSVSGLENGASWQYSSDAGRNWETVNGTLITFTGEGHKSIIARQIDAAGNISTNSEPLDFTLDAFALTPILTLKNDTGKNNDKTTHDGTVEVANLVNDASWQYSLDNGANWITGSGTSFTLTGDGYKSVTVRQTDLAGNLSMSAAPLEFTLDSIVATPTLVLKNDTGISNTDKITSDGTVKVLGLENGATWQYSINEGASWITGDGDTFTSSGNKSVVVRQIDVAGNISGNSDPLNFTLDNNAAMLKLRLANDTAQNRDRITSDGKVTVLGLEKGASWEYSEDDRLTWKVGNGDSITLTGDGHKSIIARQTDIAGNTSTISAPLNFTLDSTILAPTLALKNDTGLSNSDVITSDGTISVSGLENNAHWEYSQDNRVWHSGSGNSITIAGDGKKSVFIREIDTAGNVSDAATLAFTLRSIISHFNADVKNLFETDSILTTSGKLTGTNINKTAIVAQAATVGKYGTFDIDKTGNWHYTTSSPHNEFLKDNVYSDSFSVLIADEQKTSVTINISGTKDLPIVIDDLARQSVKQVVTNGVPQNILYGQLSLQSAQGKDIVQNADKSWTSLDLTPVTFNLDNGKIAGKDAQGHTLLKATLPNGSVMTLNTWDGSYVYVSSTSSSITDTTDIFNFSAEGVPLTISLNRYDFLDLDGIPDTVETTLADLAVSSNTVQPATSGDFNNDGMADKFQGAVADIAWISYEDFKAALDNKLLSPESVINMVVASDNTGKVDNSAQLSNIEVLPSNSAIVGGSKPRSTKIEKIDAPWDPLQFSVGAGTADGLKDVDSVRSGTQILVMIDISRAGESDFNGYMKYVSAETIKAYNAAGFALITLDGEKLTSEKQAGWYDYTQRTDGGDGAWFIKDATGKITNIAMIITDNRFGDDNLASDQITDPSLPVIANPPIVRTPPTVETPPIIETPPIKLPTDNTLKSDTDVLALPTEFNNLVLQEAQIDKTVTKTELVDNPLLCLPQWTQKLLNIPAKISQNVTVIEKVVAPLNGVGNTLDNKITGNSADNSLAGLGGQDTLTGGDGADTFVYLNQSDSSADKFDVITDFNAAQGDKVDLTGIDANTNLVGKQIFTYLGSANFTGQAGQLRFDSLSHMLLGDTDGSGHANFAIQLVGISVLPVDVLIIK